MHFTQYLLVGFAALACATPTSSKNSKGVTADTIVADIGAIRQKTNALGAVAAPYQGGRGSLGQALNINSAADEVSKALRQAIQDAQRVPPLTEDEALNIGAAVIDLNPDVIKTLDTFKSKRQAFDNPYHLSPIVRNTLKNQKSLTVQLGNAIVAKVPQDLKGTATSIQQPVLDKFDEVIAVYQ